MTAEGPGTVRPGGRTARTRAAVMQAVIDELTQNGYADTTVERVAARAGIAKTTIYRRWRSLDGLLADLMAEHAEQQIPVPNEGDLGSDLRALARSVVASVRHPGIRAAFASIVAAAVQDLAAQDVLSRFLAARVATMTLIVDRAALRGEVPPGTEAAAVIRTVTALIYYRLFIAGEPPSHDVADGAAAVAAAAARAGALARESDPARAPGRARGPDRVR